MSRRVPRTLRTLKLDYREIAALLLLPPAFPLLLVLLLYLLILVRSLTSPAAADPLRGSLLPALHRFFSFLLLLLREAPLRPPPSRVPRVLPVVRIAQHRYGRRNLLPDGGPARPRRWESVSAMPPARVRLCEYICVRADDARIRRYDAIRACEACVSVSPTQLTACRDGAG